MEDKEIEVAEGYPFIVRADGEIIIFTVSASPVDGMVFLEDAVKVLKKTIGVDAMGFIGPAIIHRRLGENEVLIVKEMKSVDELKEET